jgi:hypothetical protein
VETLVVSLCRAKSAKVRWNAAAGLAALLAVHGPSDRLLPLASNLASAAVAAAFGDSHAKVRVGAARLLAGLPRSIVAGTDVVERVVAQVAAETPPCELTDSHRWALAHLLANSTVLPATVAAGRSTTMRLVTLVDRELFASDAGPAARALDAQRAARACIAVLAGEEDYADMCRRLTSSLDVLGCNE